LPQETVQKCSAKTILLCWAKPACLTFSSCNVNLQGHRLSIGGVALSFNMCFLWLGLS
jgi:hypothetical protein